MGVRGAGRIVEKRDDEGGEDLPPELKQIKAKIESERSLHISKTFTLRCQPNAASIHASQHQFLAFIRCLGKKNNGRDSMLLSRMKTPLHRFNGYSNDSKEADEALVEVPLPRTVELPLVKQLPRSTTWVYTARHQQLLCVDGETVELGGVQEGEKEKLEFSEDVDRFIWTIGQEHRLDDPVTLTALSKFLRLNVSVISERYKELNRLKNEGNIGEVSDKNKYISLSEATDMHFCRRCLVFACQLHGEDQPVIYPGEKKCTIVENGNVRNKCSEHCYVKLIRSDTEGDHVVDNDNSISNKKGKNVVSDTNTETEDSALTATNEIIKDITKMSLACEEWTSLEKHLYSQGVKIFGRNSCLIGLNSLTGLKTCLEVYSYMRDQDQEHNETNNQVSGKKPRVVRRKAKLQKHSCYPTALRNTTKEQNKSYKQYTPCACEPVCGAQCPCLASGNCCEKYCGCLKNCKNRFGGCTCAKGHCVNRQCPCFACSRECDPDICRNCTPSCGHAPAQGERPRVNQCENMRFLLKQHKRLLVGESAIHGWGAFTRHTLKKNDFIGEYTGELISHEEANERGKIYDVSNGYSYLFTLNDKLVIDARRLGNKIRYLNHRSKPNCYAKLMTVRGDHRIGLFANRVIQEGEELFFDYCYGAEHASWLDKDIDPSSSS
ncbi:unnamed protein product [Thlaspi arvense]|uniref:[Histone H3]-lysine(27) N-trimethyltransferase n=1 Tax=Thlaspi arvense TaxID=13288 RepID=A0AAU9REJ5_THLAR|nr:unnamed protein product [Thlaspi arvense]